MELCCGAFLAPPRIILERKAMVMSCSPRSTNLRFTDPPGAALHGLIWFYTALHVAAATVLPLAANEAHYALYGAYPALSYVDHPPLTGWLQWAALSFGDSALALRAIPILLTVAAQYLLAALARRLYPGDSRWIAFLSVLVLQGALVFHMSMTMTPDVPLMLLSLGVVWVTCNVLERGGWRDWLWLGILLGLAGLAKYTAVTLALSVLIMLVRDRRMSDFRSAKPWVAIAVAAALVAPVVVWNVANDWATMAFHLGFQVRMEADDGSGIGHLLLAQAEQLAYYSPVLYLGAFAAAYAAFRRPHPSNATLLTFGLPILLVFTATSAGTRAAGHWTLVGWLLLTPMVAHWLLSSWSSRRVRILAYASAAYTTAVTLALLVILIPGIRLPDFSHPMRALVGWEAAARRADTLLTELEHNAGHEPVLLVRNWHHARRIAWFARPAIVQDVFGKFTPYSHWFGVPDADTRGLLVYPRRSRVGRSADLAPGFDCTELENMPVYYGESLAHTFFFYACSAEPTQSGKPG